MRSAEELKRRWLGLVPSMFRRSGMFATTGREMQLYAVTMLDNLGYLDDLGDEFRAATDGLSPVRQARRARPLRRDLRRRTPLRVREATFGPPSLVVDGRVLCYAPEDGSGWVFFDCRQERVVRYEAGQFEVLVEDDPLVRDGTTGQSPAKQRIHPRTANSRVPNGRLARSERETRGSMCGLAKSVSRLSGLPDCGGRVRLPRGPVRCRLSRTGPR